MRQCVVQGPYAAQLKLVGNAVPLLLGWAILGAVFEAAYGAPAPKPAFLAERPAWNGKHTTLAYVSYLVPAYHFSIRLVPGSCIPLQRFLSSLVSAHTTTCGCLSAEHFDTKLCTGPQCLHL